MANPVSVSDSPPAHLYCACNAEVCHNGLISRHQDVFRLDVAVDDALAVSVVEC